MMFSYDANSQQCRVLLLVFGLVALLVASVFVLGVHKGGSFVDTGSLAISTAMASEPAGRAPPSGLSSLAQAASDAASVKVEQGVVKFYFASGKADLAAGAGEALADLVKGARTGRKLAVSGFHDATGDAVKNAGLARKRALAVRDALMTAGVAERQIELRKPEQVTGSGSDAEARRVEISLQP